MKFAITLVAIMLALVVKAGTIITVVDKEDSSPLAYATVFANSGVIIGLTDDDGKIEVQSANDFPVIIKCLGYEPFICYSNETCAEMAHSTYSLKEVTVTPVDRPVVRVICYIREYVSGATGTDTVMNYNEHMGDFFLPLRKKVKGFKAKSSPRFLTSNLYSRMSNSDGLDSIFVPEYRDDSFCWEMMVNMPSGVPETDKIKSGAKTDSIPGKHGIKHIFRKNDSSLYSIQTDYLADSKNHKISPFIFKLLGFSIDFDELQGSWVYKANNKGRYTPADIVSGTFSLSVLGRGKWIKKAFNSDTPIQMYSFYEIYPTDIEYLTVQEAKDLINNAPTEVKMTVSPNARVLDPAIQRMVDKCNTAKPAHDND